MFFIQNKLLVIVLSNLAVLLNNHHMKCQFQLEENYIKLNCFTIYHHKWNHFADETNYYIKAKQPRLIENWCSQVRRQPVHAGRNHGEDGGQQIAGKFLFLLHFKSGSNFTKLCFYSAHCLIWPALSTLSTLYLAVRNITALLEKYVSEHKV